MLGGVCVQRVVGYFLIISHGPVMDIFPMYLVQSMKFSYIRIFLEWLKTFHIMKSHYCPHYLGYTALDP